MATRTTKLISVQPGAAAWTGLVTVPTGFTYILKSLFIMNLGGGADTVYALVQDVNGVQAGIIYGVVLAGGAKQEWNGWVVLVPGDQIRVYSNLGTTHMWFSGTKLAGVA